MTTTSRIHSQAAARIARIALWALAALATLTALLLLTATLALPGWLAGRGVELASEALGRPVRVAAAQFQPWRLALVIDEFSIAGPAPGQPPLFKLKRLDAALSLRSLLRGRPVIESLTLTQPELRLARLGEGRYDIDDLLQRFAAKPETPDAGEPEIALYNIELREGRVVFDDRPAQRRHELAGLHLALPFVSTLPADVAVKLQPQLSGQLDGVAFDSRAEALPFVDDASARLSFKFNGLDLAPLAAYLPAGAPVRLNRGRLDVDLALDFAEHAGQPARVKISGLVQLHDIALAQPDGQPLLGFKRLSLPLTDVQPLRRQLGFGRIVLESPQAWLRPLPAAAEAKSSTTPPGVPWQFSVAGAEVKDGRLMAQDLALDTIQLTLAAAAWPLTTAAQLDASLRMNQATLSAKASLSPDELQADATLTGLQLEQLTAWLPLPAGARLSAKVAAQVGLTVKGPLAADPASRTQLSVAGLRLDDLRLSLADAPQLLTLASARLDSAHIDPAARNAALGTLTLDAPRARVARDAGGRLNLAALLPPASRDTTAAAPEPTPRTSPAAGWKLQLAGLAVERGALQWRDAAVPAGMAPVALAAQPVRLRLGALSWPGAQAVQAQVFAQLAPLGANDQPVPAGAGSLQWAGQLGLAPLAATGSLQAKALPLQLFNAYLDPAWGLHLQRAELGLQAQASTRQQADGAWTASLSGDVRVGPLALVQARLADGRRVVGEDLLSWQLLQLDGLQLALAPGAPPRLAVREAQLDDAYARLIINEQGRLNLRDIGPAEAAAAAAAPAPPTAAASAPEFAVERIRVNRGLVDFSDRFIRPSYSARLSELQGSLGAFSSSGATMAPLTVRGKVAGTGTLEIDGQLKPGAPMAMDVAANATDIELAPLSPYAAKYAGYAIERGKLSTRLRYQVAPGGQLVASNQIILNQLSFGDRVDSPDATTLPVRFAVALLKDGNGVIDVNLPVSGSLNDPEFSVGSIVWKLILNLIGKALTSPFALFTGSDSAEEAQIAFLPGAAELSAIDQLDRIAKLLVDKPGVQLTLTGWAGTAAEGEALREQRLAQALKGENAATPDLALRRLYQASKLPNKPRNALGLTKDLPLDQMRSLLLGSYAVDDEALRQLAVARATTVRDALLARGAPNARVFLAAPKLCNQACDAAWRPHVELTLGAH